MFPTDLMPGRRLLTHELDGGAQVLLPIALSGAFIGITMIASVVVNDDPAQGGDEYTVLYLHRDTTTNVTTYTVASLKASDDGFFYFVLSSEDFPNIVPAVESYQENGGDY